MRGILGAGAAAVLAALLSGCASSKVNERLQGMEGTLAQVNASMSQMDQRLARLEQFSTDVDAVKSYSKDVSDRVRAMRDDTVRLLDEHRVLMEEGRDEYLRVLLQQKVMLNGMIREIDTAVRALEKRSPRPDAAVTPAPVLPVAPPAPPPAKPAEPAKPAAKAPPAKAGEPAAPPPASNPMENR
jgi:ABC-type transporter Mla subunit MlaD